MTGPRAALDFIDLKSRYAALREGISARIQKVLDHGQYIMGPEVGCRPTMRLPCSRT